MTRTDATADSPSRGRSRQRNRDALVRALTERGPQSRSQIARILEVSPTTASKIVADLLAEGVVFEREPGVPERSAGATGGSNGRQRGRPGRLVALARSSGTAVGVDIGRTHVRVIVAARDGQILTERVSPLPTGHSGEQTTPVVAGIIDDLLAGVNATRSELVGIGVGVPGPVERQSQTVGPGAILTGWVGFDVASALAQHFEVAAWADNDANLGVLAESRWGAARDVQDVAYVKVSTGIGAGLLLGGRLHRGAGGTAGELGHTAVDMDGLVCRCGNRGCLETLGSVPVVLDLLRPRMGPELTVDEVVAAARDGDPACRRVLEDVGRNVGRGIGMMCNLVDPSLVLLGGPLVAGSEHFLEAVRTAVHRTTIPSVSAHVEVARASLGDRAEALGALALALSSSASSPDLP